MRSCNVHYVRYCDYHYAKLVSCTGRAPACRDSEGVYSQTNQGTKNCAMEDFEEEGNDAGSHVYSPASRPSAFKLEYSSDDSSRASLLSAIQLRKASWRAEIERYRMRSEDDGRFEPSIIDTLKRNIQRCFSYLPLPMQGFILKMGICTYRPTPNAVPVTSLRSQVRVLRSPKQAPLDSPVNGMTDVVVDHLPKFVSRPPLKGYDSYVTIDHP